MGSCVSNVNFATFTSETLDRSARTTSGWCLTGRDLSQNDVIATSDTQGCFTGKACTASMARQLTCRSMWELHSSPDCCCVTAAIMTCNRPFA